MKAEQESKKGAETEKDGNKRVDTAFKAIIVGMMAIFLLRDPYIIYRIPYEAVVAVTSGVVLTLCISAAVFSFVKPRAWLYRVIAAVVSLFAGIIGYWNFYNETHECHEYGGMVFCTTYVSDLMISFGNTCLFMITACTVYAAVIFGSALLVQYIYKRIKKKTASTP